MKKSSLLCGVILSATLMLVGCSSNTNAQSEVQQFEQIVMVNGNLYYGTEETGPMGDAGAVGGYIAATVEESKTPTKEGESNFGCVGNPYTSDAGDGWIMVLMDDEKYHIFYKQE